MSLSVVPPYADQLESFCRREYPRLAGTLSLYTGDRELGADLAQETLARVCREWPRVSAMAAPGAWAHRVGINLANSGATRRAAERRIRAAYGAEGDASAGPDVADAVAVRAAVAELPQRQRTALVLRYFADLAVAEVAEAMGCAEGTVKALTHQAIGRLRKSGLAVEEPRQSEVRG